jgi:hypothetical protein
MSLKIRDGTSHGREGDVMSEKSYEGAGYGMAWGAGEARRRGNCGFGQGTLSTGGGIRDGTALGFAFGDGYTDGTGGKFKSVKSLRYRNTASC